MLTDIQIARAAEKRPIADIAATLGLTPQQILPYGHDKAKITHAAVAGLAGRPEGRLILVTAINPTPAGEGKTTTTVGLGDALNRIGKRATVCIREASLGPNFGMKGGAAGGGHAQVVPMEEMNLHFTGDFHAITSAHNLLAAMIDNHIYWGNALNIDTRRITWRRVMDMNDRALRDVVLGLGGVANGFARQSGFDITVASEVMAILCLSRDLADLEARLGRIVVAQDCERNPITARDLQADGAMTVLLKDALQPNLVQTLENNPALVHGGPFANIAHGCNSVIATRAALRLSDYVVTEAGFGADLGAEKFLEHQVPAGGAGPFGRGAGGDGAGAEDERRRRQGGSGRRECARCHARAAPISAGISRTSAASACPWSSPSTISPATPKPRLPPFRTTARPMGCRRSSRGTGRRAGQGPRTRPRRRGDGRGRDGRLPHALSRRDAAVAEDRDDRDAHLPRRPRRGRSRHPRATGRVGSRRPWPHAGLHREDAIQLLDRPRGAGRARGPCHPGPRSAAESQARASSWRSAVRS